MAKIVFLAPYPFDSAPSQRFRFEQYWTELQKDHQLEFHSFINHQLWSTLYSEGKFFQKSAGMFRAFIKRILLLPKLFGADYIFIHREASQIGPPVFEWIIAKILRKKYIFDFDDAIWMPNYSDTNATFQRLKAYWKTKHIIRWAHKISAGNTFLAEFAKQYNDNVVIIPTTIDTEYHRPLEKKDSPIVRIGWTGSHTTMQYLPLLVESIRNLSKKHNLELVVISNENPNLPLENFRFIKWTKSTEIEDLSTFDIGVMPLISNHWSSGKCGFKALQYLSMEIPTILSPVGVNNEIIEQGKEGLFASDTDQWEAALEQLILNTNLRKEMGKNGRIKVISKYSVHSQMNNYKSLFN